MYKTTQEEIIKSNEEILKYLGFVHIVRNVPMDFSDIGGLDSDTTIYSKVPIEVWTTDEYGNNYVSDEWWRENRDQFTYKSVGYDAYDYTDFHQDWNKLHQVIEFIEKDERSPKFVLNSSDVYFETDDTYGVSGYSSLGFSRIEATWMAVILYIRKYGNR